MAPDHLIPCQLFKDVAIWEQTAKDAELESDRDIMVFRLSCIGTTKKKGALRNRPKKITGDNNRGLFFGLESGRGAVRVGGRAGQRRAAHPLIGQFEVLRLAGCIMLLAEQEPLGLLPRCRVFDHLLRSTLVLMTGT